MLEQSLRDVGVRFGFRSPPRIFHCLSARCFVATASTRPNASCSATNAAHAGVLASDTATTITGGWAMISLGFCEFGFIPCRRQSVGRGVARSNDLLNWLVLLFRYCRASWPALGCGNE